MALLNLIDMAVGLIVIWLILSFIVMQIQEWLAAQLKLRPRMLEETIGNMLGKPLTAQFYAHPLIRSISSGKSRPSYIPSNQFSSVLLDLVQSTGDESTFFLQQVTQLYETLAARRNRNVTKLILPHLKAIMEDLKSKTGSPADTRKNLDSAAEALRRLAQDAPAVEDDIQATLNTIEEARKKMALTTLDKELTTAEATIQKLKSGMAALSVTEPGLHQSLRVVLSSVGQYAAQPENALAFTRQGLQEWFDSVMERLNGRYKRRAVMISFAIGMVIALILNIDSLLLANYLWEQNYSREELLRQAQAYLSASTTPDQASDFGQTLLLKTRFAVYSMPFGWVGMPVTAPGGNMLAVCTPPQLESGILGLSISRQCFPIINAPRFGDYSGWLFKLTGLLVTGLAAAQGAPFWFDILKKIVNIRTSGVNPSESSVRVG